MSDDSDGNPGTVSAPPAPSAVPASPPAVRFRPGSSWRLTGRIKVHPAGYGFVVPSDNSEDVHVSSRARGTAMDGDTVEIDAWVGHRGIEGRVVQILERGRAKITGRLVTAGRFTRLDPDDPRITGTVTITAGEAAAVAAAAAATAAGSAVLVEITRYPGGPGGDIEARLLRVLGDPDDPRTEVEKVLAVADIEQSFPEEIERAAAALPREVTAADRRDRADLRHVPFTTIDPETARDFDDAVAVEALPGGGHRLWVAVADVSHYVREGTPLDAEGRRRGCSIYLPNRAIPMLPEPLSAHLCSLVPNEDRLAMVVRIDLDRQADVVETDFAAAVIHSQGRLDYPGVAAALGGDTRGKRRKYEPFLPALQTMNALAQKLRALRFERGSLDLDLPEAFVELDHDDPRLVRDVRKSRRDPGEKQAYSMIEELMLAANEAVAASFQLRHEDAVWRVHDAPDSGRLEEFAALAEHYGVPFDPDDARTPKGLRRVLERLRGHPAEKPLSFALLRSLKQATYDVVNLGHFGLASRDYVHFTSPIRRYPDVIVHRLLKMRLASQGKPAGGFVNPAAPQPIPSKTELQRMAADASFAERTAMEVEREVVDLYRAYFMRDRIGDVFEGTISGVLGFGLFVVIDHPFIEGLVRVDTLGDDAYEFDETTARLVGRRSGRTFALGDSVKVEVQSVSVGRRKIDFVLHEHRGHERSRATADADAAGGGRRGRRGERRARRAALEAEEAARAGRRGKGDRKAAAAAAGAGRGEGKKKRPAPPKRGGKGGPPARAGAGGTKPGARPKSGRGARKGRGPRR